MGHSLTLDDRANVGMRQSSIDIFLELDFAMRFILSNHNFQKLMTAIDSSI